jgi:hypothetical protein
MAKGRGAGSKGFPQSAEGVLSKGGGYDPNKNIFKFILTPCSQMFTAVNISGFNLPIPKTANLAVLPCHKNASFLHPKKLLQF